MALLAYTLAAPTHEETKPLQPTTADVKTDDPNSHIQIIPKREDQTNPQGAASRDVAASVQLRPEITKRETENEKDKFLPTQVPIIESNHQEVKDEKSPQTPLSANLPNSPKAKRETPKAENIPTLGNSQLAANDNHLKTKQNENIQQSSPVQSDTEKLKRETVSEPSTLIDAVKKVPENSSLAKKDEPAKNDQTTTTKKPNRRRRKPSTVANTSTVASAPVIVTPSPATTEKKN